MSHDDCPQEPVILEMQRHQIKLDAKVDEVLKNQHALGETMTTALNRLTSMIEADIGTRKDVEQGKKELALLFDFHRKDAARIDAIEIRNAKCDGAGIFLEWPTVRNFVQQEKGWRRFIPALMTVGSFMILIYVTFGD